MLIQSKSACIRARKIIALEAKNKGAKQPVDYKYVV